MRRRCRSGGAGLSSWTRVEEELDMTDGKGIAPTRELPYLAEWEEPMSELQGRESK